MPDKRSMIGPVLPSAQPAGRVPAGKKEPPGSLTPFNQILEQQLGQGNGVKLSEHARQRLQSRNIQLTPADFGKINTAVAKAAGKGAKESLILLDNRAFVVSISNRIVITVVDGANLKENVFTNIDSAVIMS